LSLRGHVICPLARRSSRPRPLTKHLLRQISRTLPLIVRPAATADLSNARTFFCPQGTPGNSEPRSGGPNPAGLLFAAKLKRFARERLGQLSAKNTFKPRPMIRRGLSLSHAVHHPGLQASASFPGHHLGDKRRRVDPDAPAASNSSCLSARAAPAGLPLDAEQSRLTKSLALCASAHGDRNGERPRSVSFVEATP
jgi:hypothetical protein